MNLHRFQVVADIFARTFFHFPLIRLFRFLTEKSTCTLAVPKIFCGIRLEYFDRGAKPYSLFRPLGALRKLCSEGRLKRIPSQPSRTSR